MIGTSWIREQGLKDALLVEALRRRNMDSVPLWSRKVPARDDCMKAWDDMTPLRDGPVNRDRLVGQICILGFCRLGDFPAVIPNQKQCEP